MILASVLAASLALAVAPTSVGSHRASCELDIQLDAAHGEAGAWTTHPHPTWTWNTACERYPDVEAFVVYPSWGDAFTTTNGSFHATGAPDGVLSIQVVGVWSRTDDEGRVRFHVTDATESPRIGVDADAPGVSPHVTRGADHARDGVTWVNARGVIDPDFHDDESGISGRAARVAGGNWTIPNERGFRLGGEDGVRTLQFIASDRAGNVATHEARFGLDTTAPEVELVAPDVSHEGIANVTRPLDVEVRATDAGAGVRTVVVFMDGEPVRLASPDEPQGEVSATLTVPAFMVEPGTHRLVVRAMDAVGNQVDTTPATVRVD